MIDSRAFPGDDPRHRRAGGGASARVNDPNRESGRQRPMPRAAERRHGALKDIGAAAAGLYTTTIAEGPRIEASGAAGSRSTGSPCGGGGPGYRARRRAEPMLVCLALGQEPLGALGSASRPLPPRRADGRGRPRDRAARQCAHAPAALGRHPNSPAGDRILGRRSVPSARQVPVAPCTSGSGVGGRKAQPLTPDTVVARPHIHVSRIARIEYKRIFPLELT